MGNLMKDVPATRYALLDRVRPEQQVAQPIRKANAPKQTTPAKRLQPNKQPGADQQYRSTAEELEAYIQQTYER